MKISKKGVSLIALIITIAVLVIISGITIQKGFQRTNDAKLAEHNMNISATQEEVESYYYYQGGQLPVVDLTPYPIPAGSSLLTEITKNGEQNDTFYTVDLSKLGKVSGKEGTTGGNDVYIVSSVRHTVYYVKGDTINGVTYNGLITKNDVKLAQITPVSGGGPTPGNGTWDGTVNSPKLSAGMTPVRWNGSAWVDLTPTEQLNVSHEWYDYSNTGGTANKWGNARLKDGSLLVWIPRYTYSITSGFHTSTAGNIDIRFTNGTADDTSGGYKIHPAFYWGGWSVPEGGAMVKQGGGIELTGIWVGKFEASPIEGTAGSLAGDNVTTKHVQIKPNVASWRYIQVSNIFTVCRNIQSDSATYGDLSSSDTHMLKNSEWGAVAYLSKYALGGIKVTVNPNSSYITANGDIVTYKVESTTGTEYGIYDMSGCSYEYVSAYIDNSNVNTFGASAYAANAKYKDIFPKSASDGTDGSGNYAGISQAYGNAIYETSSSYSGTTSWFSGYSSMPYSTWPWVVRGGPYNFSTNNGLFFFDNYNGWGIVSYSFRVALCVP